MSKKIVKQIRASVDYLSSLKVYSSLEVQKVVDFLFEAAFFDRDDDYFAKIIKADGCDAEKYLWFDGKRYTRQEDGHYRGYHGKYLHRAVWEHFNGKIPKGYVVHHVDFNPANNDIANLTLLTKAEHKKLHTELYEPKKYICEYCGKEFERKHRGKPNKFCCRECGYKWTYRNNHEIRTCAECGKEFVAYKYSRKKYCSISCSNKARSQKKIGNKPFASLFFCKIPMPQDFFPNALCFAEENPSRDQLCSVQLIFYADSRLFNAPTPL